MTRTRKEPCSVRDAARERIKELEEEIVRLRARLAAVVTLLRQGHAKSHPAHDEDDCCLAIRALRQAAEGKP